MMFSNPCCAEFGKAAPLDAMVPQSEIGPLYDKIARVYDVWGKLTESRARDRALALAEIQDGSMILEVAVGTGMAFERIVGLNPNGRNIGVDLSEGMLAKARRRLSKSGFDNYELWRGSAGALELDSGSVDVLVNNYMFDLIPFEEMDPVLAEFKRVLKPSGKLLMVNMTVDRGFGIYDRLYKRFPKAMGGCRGVELSERLENNGFRVAQREFARQFFFPSEIILASGDNTGLGQ